MHYTLLYSKTAEFKQWVHAFLLTLPFEPAHQARCTLTESLSVVTQHVVNGLSVS